MKAVVIDARIYIEGAGVAAGKRLLLISGLTALLFMLCNAILLRSMLGGDAKSNLARWEVGDAQRLSQYQTREANRSGTEHNPVSFRAANFSDCRELWSNIDDASYLGQGWTKEVYGGKYAGQNVAVKVIGFDAHDMKKCRSFGGKEASCYSTVSKKLVKEIEVLGQLSHDNVVKLLAFCAPSYYDMMDLRSLVSVVTELGDTVHLLKILQMPWELRLRMAIGVAQLTEYFAIHSLVLNDFKKEQFVLVDGVIKLSDVDDVGHVNPTCSTDADCTIYLQNFNVTLSSSCVGRVCHQYNDRLNVFNAGRHFMDVLLRYGVPTDLQASVSSIVEGYNRADRTARELLHELRHLVAKSNGGESVP